METADVRRALEEVELSQDHADPYTTLLQFGSASVTEVSISVDVPEGRIDDVLRNLDYRGYVETDDQKNLDTSGRENQFVDPGRMMR